MSGREKNKMTKIKNVEVAKEEGLSYVAVQSAPRECVDLLAIFQCLLIGATGASALMAIGAWLAISLVR